MQKVDPDPNNVVITKLFVGKFCAECTGRELHSSHGDPFPGKSKIWIELNWFRIDNLKRIELENPLKRSRLGRIVTELVNWLNRFAVMSDHVKPQNMQQDDN